MAMPESLPGLAGLLERWHSGFMGQIEVSATSSHPLYMLIFLILNRLSACDDPPNAFSLPAGPGPDPRLCLGPRSAAIFR